MGEVRFMENIIKRKKQNVPDNLNIDALHNLILRVTGKEEYADKFCFVKSDADEMDYYRMYDKENKIMVEAPNTLSAAVAFNYYLKNKCNCYFGVINTNMILPDVPPDMGESHMQKSKFLYRYFMNYCTFAYTLLFAGWAEYERLIDWMALSGINLVLNIVGHEIVERDMLIELGYTKDEAVKYITGPAYHPWQWMGNMTEFGGDMPDWYFEKQKSLRRKINSRLEEFGIAPMLPGFYGLVPGDFEEKFAGTHPVKQGKWGSFDRQPILLNSDPMFERCADIFYNKTREHFGDIKYFSGDPFHEGGLTEGIDITEFMKALSRKSKQHFENSVWFLQGWQVNPRKEALLGFGKEDVIVGFLSADKAGMNFNGYSGYPWLYMCTQNFGGTKKQDGFIKAMLKEPFAFMNSPEKMMIGVGMTMEAIEMDEPVFDCLSEISIRDSAPAPEDFIEVCVKSRYGYINDNLKKIYNLMLEEIYIASSEVSYRGRESILCARPNLDAEVVSFWSVVDDWYSSETLLKITSGLFAEYDKLKDNECYCLDLIDFARQYAAEKGREYLKKFAAAWHKKDFAAFEKYTSKFLSLHDMNDRLMSTNKHTRLDVWLNRAEKYSEDDNYKKIFRFNAQNLILLWAGTEGYPEIHDYAYREWNGMLPYYKKRWEIYIDELKEQFGCDEVKDTVDWAKLDYEFTMRNSEGYAAKKMQTTLFEAVGDILNITD